MLGAALGVALAAAPQAQGQKAIGEVFSSDASVRGSVSFSGGGTRVLSGSQVMAGDVAALLKLERGGLLRICPKTNLSLSADAGGTALALGLNTGAMELHYELSGAVDALMTPDFRLQLISPGRFHLAISVSPSGDTCLRTLAGDDAAVFVSEMMGSGSYQLSPGKSVLFRGGKISGATQAPTECGCPEIRVASEASQGTRKAAALAETQAAAQSTTQTATPPASDPGVAHLEVDSAFVYRGSEVAQDYYESVSRLSLSTDNSKLTLALLPSVRPPAGESKPAEKKEGLMQRLGGFLGRMFRR
jgi:hypothetical protein